MIHITTVAVNTGEQCSASTVFTFTTCQESYRDSVYKEQGFSYRYGKLLFLKVKFPPLAEDENCPALCTDARFTTGIVI